MTEVPPQEVIRVMLHMKDTALLQALQELPKDTPIRGQLETALVKPGSDIEKWLGE